MNTSSAQDPDSDPILPHLEDELAWFDRKSKTNQRAYKFIKIVEIVAAAAIPSLAVLERPHIVILTSGVGVLIILLEAILHLNQYQQNAINYRSRYEALKHEKYTYFAKAAPDANVPNLDSVLPPRIVLGAHVKGSSIHQNKVEEPEDEFPSSHSPNVKDIRVHVATQAGELHAVDVPPDLTVVVFISELVAGLNLPRLDAEGMPVNWTIDDRELGRTLDWSRTIAESGVRAGHRLYLRRNVVAGGGPMEPRTSTDTAPIEYGLSARNSINEYRPPVQLSVHYPPRVEPNVWSTLLTYVHDPGALKTIQEQTDLRLGRQIADGYLRTSGIAMTDIGPGAEITVIPTVPDCQVKPERLKFLWLEDWHCGEFQFKLTQQAGSQPLIGQISFYVGPILICDIAIFIRPSGRARVEDSTRTTSDPYQSIFVSYAHDDSLIVEELEKAYTVLGMRYLRDVRILRSGEKWNPALLSKIEEADIFQLCWTHSAKRSEYVTAEWKHALGLNRECFLRPVYWQAPMPEPPTELAAIHFAFLDV